MLYVVDPRFAAVPAEEARAFLGAAREQLQSVPTSEIASIEAILAAEPNSADGVIFFNPPAEQVASELEALLERAAGAGAVVLPIALGEQWRRPLGSVGEYQSFDVVDQRRLRSLDQGQLETVARAFARDALSRIQPTYSRDRLRLFLCHRREDGEALVARLAQRLDVLHPGHVFRDLVDVQVGERAQERIAESLASADALVFFDTPEAADSWWIAHELSQALGRNIPIVWVRLGPPEPRHELPVRPSAEPQIEIPGLDLSDAETQALADTILQTAFEMSRAHVRVSEAALRALKTWAQESNAEFQTLDARRLIYELRHAPAERNYPARPATDIVQIFARHPTDEDHELLASYLAENGLGPHERECRSFDAALLLDPTATGQSGVGEWSVVEHPERFLQTLRAPVRSEAPGPTLLLLGAFPAGELSHQEVIQAVHALSTTWLGLGGSIVFGGHPTFTPLVIEAGRLIVPGQERERLTVFQSRWFASPAVLEELAASSNVVATADAGDRESSLTVMRTEMCGSGADAAIAIGGRTDEAGTHRPGIDQELELSRAAGIPAFLLGAPGGRAAELAAAATSEEEPWSSLGNTIAPEQNTSLFLDDDYEGAAHLIYSTLS